MPGSGLPELMGRLLEANRLAPDALLLSNLEQSAAAEALQAGLLDAIVLSSAPQSPQVQRLLRANDIRLMDFVQADAYTRRFPFLSAVTLPRGVVDLSKDLPAGDVSLLAATTSLLSRGDTHPRCASCSRRRRSTCTAAPAGSTGRATSRTPAPANCR